MRVRLVIRKSRIRSPPDPALRLIVKYLLWTFFPVLRFKKGSQILVKECAQVLVGRLGERKLSFLKTLGSVSIIVMSIYEGESISNQPNLFPVEIHLFFFDVIAL